jgi:TATA-binding protein-associated factor Taf7
LADFEDVSSTYKEKAKKSMKEDDEEEEDGDDEDYESNPSDEDKEEIEEVLTMKSILSLSLDFPLYRRRSRGFRAVQVTNIGRLSKFVPYSYISFYS